MSWGDPYTGFYAEDQIEDVKNNFFPGSVHLVQSPNGIALFSFQEQKAEFKTRVKGFATIISVLPKSDYNYFFVLCDNIYGWVEYSVFKQATQQL